MLLLNIIFICIVFFILCFFFKNKFTFMCTLITLTFYTFLISFISLFILINYKFMKSSILVYFIPTFSLIAYLYFGVFINKIMLIFFSRKFYALKNIEYNFNILRYHLILIFVILFIYLNINGFFYKKDLNDTVFLVRNVFFTIIPLAMINITPIFDIDSLSNRWIKRFEPTK
uniref:Uncharacterized protein n=2 Tax=Clostridioides difficile TaxID=1496 RepID=A0A386JBW0_CLODI|nr:hypothetical protein pHSJD-312_00051 [Clostridioides difficile]